MSVSRILVVDDEPDLCEILCFNLENEGYVVDYAYSAEEALAKIGSSGPFSLVLLDVMMERMSGYEMARLLRQRGDDTPVIFLTARDAEQDQLEGFASGGDDYITKPFSFPSVLARVKAVLKRSRRADDGVMSPSAVYEMTEAHASSPLSGTRKPGLVVDIEHKQVLVDGEKVALTRKEFGILTLLIRGGGEHFKREEILSKVWEDDAYVTHRSVDVHIARLRKKLGRAGNCIVNHSGFGYAFISDNH